MTSDSVVATATIHYTDTPSLVTVQWGDGTSSSRNPSDPTDSPFPDPWAPTDPPGVSVFKHAYAAPSDGATFPVAITAQIGTESQAEAVFMTPRYRVTQHAASLTPMQPCDSAFESETEWRVERHSGVFGGRAWEFDLDEPSAWVGDYPGETYLLPDSAVTFEGTVAEARKVGYKVTEQDPIDDDLRNTEKLLDFDPRLGSRSVYIRYYDFNTPFTGVSCAAELRTDIDVTVLMPGLGGGPIGRQ